MIFKLPKEKRSNFAALLLAATSGIGLAVFVWLGSFTRLLADDYYHIFLTRDANLIVASYEKYLVASNRYTNLFLFALADRIGAKWMPALLIVLWVFGLAWLFSEIRKKLPLQLPAALILTLAALLPFLSILQAPNRYQTIYWLSGMATYFAPLVFFPFLLAANFVFLCASRTKLAIFGMVIVNLLAAFLIGGLSETVGAFHITVVAPIILAFWLWGKKEERTQVTLLFGALLFGALLSLAVMALSPANAIRSSNGAVGLAVLLRRLFIFPYGFISDTFKSLPLPSLFTVLVGFLIFSPLWGERKKGVPIALLLVPVITFILIAASFAPSAYALSYPDARVRFPARVALTTGLFIEGALLGLWLGREKFQGWATLLLVAVALYPLRGAYQASLTASDYRAYAAAWDRRDAFIQSQRERGIMEIAVPRMDGLAGIKELDVDPNHWVNRGAAEYYGVDAISVRSSDLFYDE